jgi:hypothetical protein
MANKFATNFPIPSATNVFQCVWKLSRIMKAAGWTTMASSDGTTKDTTGTQSNDKWGGNADPTADAYPVNSLSDSSNGWIVLRGPSVLKIPLNAAPTGVPVRGETITQATSAAEGELVGFIWDSVGLSGWAVVLPRTGTFDNSHTITGATSGATMVPTGTIVTFVREVVFSKSTAGSTVNGQIFYGVFDVSGESAQLFTTMAASAGCTASVPPWGGGTGNTLATSPKAIAVRGTGGSTTVDSWFGNTASFQTNAQIACVNAVAATGVSADGSFYCVLSNSTISNGCSGIVLSRLDDTEPGDCDPYIFMTSQISQSFSTWTGQSTTSSATSVTFQNGSIFSSNNPFFFGYQSRGNTVTTRDTINGYTGSLQYTPLGNTYMLSNGGLSGAMKAVASPATTLPLIREPLTIQTTGVTSITNATRQVKGRCRWISCFTVGSTYDTYDSKQWLCTFVATTNQPAIAVGPYDGSTTPVQ